jgi:glyoxylase-like metal-dependent hydrolase (beta-lactamase superfamily II)
VAQGALDMRWDPGAEQCDAAKQRTQLHAYDEATTVIRQNPCVDYEANLLYLLIGTERALLIDSGATDDARLTAELTGLVGEYLKRADGSRLPLVVAHTHGHQDHRAGDAAFAALPATTVVPHAGEGMREFFGFVDWPDQEVRFDLGQRQVTLIPTPGHHPDHVVFFDPRTQVLFSGDFLLPGRLLVEDIQSYARSAAAMVEAAATHGITHALGAHIEMDAGGELYPNGATYHPNERQVALPFDAQRAAELRQALEDFNGFYSRHPSYVIVNPIRNLMVLAAGVIAALVLLVWLVRRLRRRIRARRAAVA